MREINDIQVLRGLAALGVVVFHAQQELTWRHFPLWLPDLVFGAAGVDVFFVISGFIILYVSSHLFGNLASVVPFVARRAIRIAPLYWLACMCATIYIFEYNLPPYNAHATERWLVLSMLFVPVHNNAPLLATGWTLNYEMFFYVCFAAVLPLRRRQALLVLSFGFVAYGLAGPLDLLPTWGSALANSLVFEFVAGLWIAEARLSGILLDRWSTSALLGAGLLALVVSLQFDLNSWILWRGVVWGLPASALVAAGALTMNGASGRAGLLLKRLGDASYATYICHYTLFGLMSREVLPALGSGSVGATIYFVLLIMAALTLGWLVHTKIERPMYRWMTGRRLHPAPAIST